jgi:alkylated DNA repair protein alkB family protein 6
MTTADAKEGLQAFRIAGLPPNFYYIPNFLTVEEEASILNKVCKNEPVFEQAQPQIKNYECSPIIVFSSNHLLTSP